MSHRISLAPCGPWAPATNTARDMMVIGASSASNLGIADRAANVVFFILFMSCHLSSPGGHNLGFESFVYRQRGLLVPELTGTCNPPLNQAPVNCSFSLVTLPFPRPAPS